MIGVPKELTMAKIRKITSSRDELIDKLIDDKNRLFMRKKKLESEIEILKNQISYFKRKYEYILWLGKKLQEPNDSILIPENKVKGCVSEVFVKGIFREGILYWEG